MIDFLFRENFVVVLILKCYFHKNRAKPHILSSENHEKNAALALVLTTRVVELLDKNSDFCASDQTFSLFSSSKTRFLPTILCSLATIRCVKTAFLRT